MQDHDDQDDVPDRTFHDFQAIHDHMPGKNMTLTVSGQVEYPEDCWTVSLDRMRSGINPKILMLRLYESKGDVCLEKITREPVSWSESTETEYTEVQILPGGPTLPVQCVH